MSAVLLCAGRSLPAFHIDVGGRMWVYRHGDGTLALAEVVYAGGRARR
jgi:hypothetical protein